MGRIEKRQIINRLTKAELGHKEIEVHVYELRWRNPKGKIVIRYKIGVRVDDTAFELDDDNLAKTPIKGINSIIAQYWADKIKQDG